MTLVADTSALVSLGCAEPDYTSLVDRFFVGYDVVLPRLVVEELEEMAAYDDPHGRAAAVIVDAEGYEVEDVDTDPDFPLDSGENAVVQLSNELGAEFCYCDEYNRLAMIHASLAETTVVTTPRLLHAFVRRGELSDAEARELLEYLSSVRSWTGNAYVEQTRSWFDESSG